VSSPPRAQPERPLRIGIINIMPRAESYEAYLSRPLARAPLPVQPIWIRLESHVYSSSDRDHIMRSYRTFDEVSAPAGLDGLILTGAPVEELPFEDVTYWPELSRILARARHEIPSTLGLCWGGLALAKQLGIDKQRFARKLFGVFRDRNLTPNEGVLGDADDWFWCAHSRHSGIADRELERARDAGAVRLLSHGADTGYSIFESADRRFVMHLGHPEYEPSRLVEEWERDARLGRADVEAPKNFDLDQPANLWRSHRSGLFSRWLALIAQTAATTGA
jgi:homoserine O-succinyltransferase